MLVQDKKLMFQGNQIRLNYNLNNKVAGSMVGCPIIAKINGIELTQTQYDDSTKSYVPGTVMYTIDFNKIITDLFAGNVANFRAAITSCEYGTSCNIYQPSTDSYLYTPNFTSFAKCIKDDGTVDAKIQDAKGLQISIIINKTPDIMKPIKTELPATWAMLFQNIGIPYQPNGGEEKTLFSIVGDAGPIVEYVKCDFSDGLVPAAFTQVGSGVKVVADPKNSANKVIAFNNQGQDNSQAEFDITVGNGISGAYDIKFDYMISSEGNYDKLSIYLNDTLGLQISGSSGGANVHTNGLNFKNILANEWNKGVIKGLSGTNTLKFIYSKDGSGGSGYDNAFIDNIVVSTSEPPNLRAYWSSGRIYLVKDNSPIAYTSPIDVDIKTGVFVNVELEQTATGLYLRVLVGSSTTAEKVGIEGKNISAGKYKIYPLALFNGAGYVSSGEKPAVADAIFIVKDKNFTDAEALNMLKGIAKGFEKPKIKSGYVIPGNTSYSITGTVDVLSETKVTRTVIDVAQLICTQKENRIMLHDGAVVKQYNS